MPPPPSEDPAVSALPAFDRVQTRPPAEPASRFHPWMAVLAAALLALAGVLTWSVWPEDSGPESILTHLVGGAASFQPELGTTQPEEAQALVLDALGWLVTPPDLPSLAIVGVGIPSIGSVQPSAAASPMAVEVPAFRYEGAAGERATVFAYDYILLDRVRTTFDLPDGTYAALSEPTPVDSRVVEGEFVVTWRRRSMIFSAVTPSEAVAERIRQAVSS